jgi:NAD(P)-dependent dehydrogenase (short-subunit alcohol dehydrogenase family)
MKRLPGTEVTQGATWTAADIGDLTGFTALVTGANSGIGYETVRALSDHGAHVVMGCRNEEKARKARDRLESELTRSSLELLALDLADLDSVRRGAEAFLSRHARLDLLVNNAGVMGTPYRQTADGFELQMATNHLGHFALTGLLLNRIVTTERSRVVTVSSHMHRLGRLDLDDVAHSTPHNPWVTYGTSKLANLLFTRELSRRLAGEGLATMALAAHPGWAQSNLAGNGTALSESRVRRTLGRTVGSTLGQTTANGALPVLCASTSPAVHSGDYVGPSRLFGLVGAPRLTRPSRPGRDGAAAAELWKCSEELTGVSYPLGAFVSAQRQTAPSERAESAVT